MILDPAFSLAMMRSLEMRDDLGFKKYDNVPPVKDASWKTLSAPLLRYMEAQPKSTVEILSWCRSQGHTGSLSRHLLAYLSFTNVVRYDPSDSLWKAGPEPTLIIPQSIVGSFDDDVYALSREEQSDIEL